MKNIVKNWKTTLAGILVVVIPVVTQLGYITPEMAGAIVTILTGLGLIAAKDHNVTGGTNNQTPPNNTNTTTGA